MTFRWSYQAPLAAAAQQALYCSCAHNGSNMVMLWGITLLTSLLSSYFFFRKPHYLPLPLPPREEERRLCTSRRQSIYKQACNLPLKEHLLLFFFFLLLTPLLVPTQLGSRVYRKIDANIIFLHGTTHCYWLECTGVRIWRQIEWVRCVMVMVVVVVVVSPWRDSWCAVFPPSQPTRLPDQQRQE